MKLKLLVYLVIVYLCANSVLSSTHFEIRFKDNASGGTLVFCDPLSRNARCVSIETQLGEPAASVVSRLGEAIINSDITGWGDDYSEEELQELREWTIRGNSLYLPHGMGRYLISGTETGLGIPRPVTSVSCTYNASDDHIEVYWKNPSVEAYDRMMILSKWIDDSTGKPVSHVRTDTAGGTISQFSLQRVLFEDRPPVNVDNLDVWVIGFRDHIASNAAGIHYNYHKKTQEELFGIPFRAGVAPNWTAWGTKNSPELTQKQIDLQQLTRPEKPEYIQREHVRMKMLLSPDAKPYEQILKVPATGGTVGIWRQFLGLHPGHTYRITARLNTLAMGPDGADWSYSLHAVADRPGRSGLNASQMAGLTALPDGRSGNEAGKMAAFGKDRTTAGDYESCLAEITLPADSDSITVWLRLAAQAAGEVGFDWIKLDDLGHLDD